MSTARGHFEDTEGRSLELPSFPSGKQVSWGGGEGLSGLPPPSSGKLGMWPSLHHREKPFLTSLQQFIGGEKKEIPREEARKY